MLYVFRGTLHRPLYLVLSLVFGLQHFFFFVMFSFNYCCIYVVTVIYLLGFFVFVHCGQ